MKCDNSSIDATHACMLFKLSNKLNVVIYATYRLVIQQ